MSLNAASSGSGPNATGSIPTEIPPRFSWRLALFRGLAAAHVVAGVTELASVAGNYVLQLQYMEGPMARRRDNHSLVGCRTACRPIPQLRWCPG